MPSNDRGLVRRIVRFLATQDYVGGLFVNDRLGQVPGALRMSDVGLMGGATTPKPAIVVNFKSFSLDPKNPHMSGVIVGGVRQHGQGDHGSLARANTFNNMAAIGPDFKKRFVDPSPVSNADVQPTLAHVMKMKIPQTRRSSRPRPHGSARRRTRDDEICARRCALAPVIGRVLDRV